MDDEKPPTAAPRETGGRGNRRWPIWPWVAGTIVIALASAAFSFWWPMRQANRTLDFIKANRGTLWLDIDHPEWMIFLGKKTFHPWFDRVKWIHQFDRVDDPFLEDIQMFPEIEQLELDLSEASPSAIESLSCFESLQHLRIDGNDETIPLDWIASSPRLTYLKLQNLVVSEADAHLPESLPQLRHFDLYNCRIPSEFWQVMSRNRELKRLELRRVNLDDGGLNSLRRLSSLTALELYETHVTVEGLKAFEDARPDVEVYSDLPIPDTATYRSGY